MIERSVHNDRQHHYHPRDLSWGERTSAMWAFAPNGTLVVFVHGFGGAATETWLEFPGLLSAGAKGRDSDVIFYGYDGLRKRAYVSAIELLSFLSEISGNTVAVVNASLPSTATRRAPRFKWKKVVIVAHSLGAVVSRQTLLMAHKRRDSWVSSVSLVLFAPAHSGADVLKLAAEALTGLPGWIPAMFKYRYQVLQDLEPGSEMLKRLREGVEKAIPGAPYLIAKSVVIAANDKIVSPLPFLDDPDPPLLFAARSHTDVCKPTRGFAAPLVVVEDAL